MIQIVPNIGLTNTTDSKRSKPNSMSDCLNIYVNQSGSICSFSEMIQHTSIRLLDIEQIKDKYYYLNIDRYFGYIDIDTFTFNPICRISADKIYYTTYSDYFFISSLDGIKRIKDISIFNFDTVLDTYDLPIKAGYFIEIFNNRLFSVYNNILYISKPLKFNIYDRRFGWIVFNSRITSLFSSGGKLFVSDEYALYSVIYDEALKQYILIKELDEPIFVHKKIPQHLTKYLNIDGINKQDIVVGISRNNMYLFCREDNKRPILINKRYTLTNDICDIQFMLEKDIDGDTCLLFLLKKY